MGDAIITRRGGGGGKAYAAIYVKYPAGSVCTCTKGARTLSAAGTGGEFIFRLPEGGTWTVTAASASDSASASVAITYEHQCGYVQLSYTLGLYAGGDENTPVTGSWKKARGAIEKGVNYLVSRGNGSECGIAQTTSKVNVSPYSTMHLGCYSAGSGNFSFGLTSSSTHTSGGPSNVAASNDWTGDKDFQDFVLDVRSVTGSYYAYICSKNSGTTPRIVMSYMYLE